MLQKLDNTQTGSVEIAIGKARTARLSAAGQGDARRCRRWWRRSASAFGAQHVGAGRWGTVIVDGKVVGAVGVSGVTSEQDAQVAMAGAAAAK
jgi:uncharacterized protein GlcG (DUF336 family)